MPKSDVTQLHPEKECERLIQELTESIGNKNKNKRKDRRGADVQFYKCTITIHNHSSSRNDDE